MSNPQHRATAPASDVRRPASATAAGCDPRLEHEVLRGLLSTPKTLPPKLFYDADGAALFERICTLPEYYPTRAELEILERRAPDIAALAGAGATLVEYGSGAGVKVRLILDALEKPAAYIPIDISAEQLSRVAAELSAEYPSLSVHPLPADYSQPLVLPPVPAGSRRVAFFPGSTIGNFHPTEAAAFLTRIRRSVGPGGLLVLGVDRIKDASVLHAAYDDAAGVTAAFNLNLLRRLNRELGADFDLEAFAHRAVVNEQARRVEMHLVSTRDQVVHISGARIPFEAGESIWTESSYKYDADMLEDVITSAGFRSVHVWTDSRERFWVGCFTAM